MARFRKKPIEIEAVQWTGDNLGEIEALVEVGLGHPGDAPYVLVNDRDVAHVVVTTAQMQRVSAAPGEWIVPETTPGRAYPVAADVFAATYDPA